MSQVKVRWIVKNDIGRVVEIERECFPRPWGEEDFSECLRRRQNIGKVAVVDGAIVGFMLYELGEKKISVINIAVCKGQRRNGIGRTMVRHLQSKLSNPKYWLSVEARVMDDNLEAHLFLKGLGFRAVAVDREFFTDEDGSCDSYLFVYDHDRLCDNELVGRAEDIL